MGFLTNDKLVIVGAGGAIGSTMVQPALTMPRSLQAHNF